MPDGTQAYSVICASKDLCYRDARQACAGNFEVVSEGGGHSAIVPTPNGPVGGQSYVEMMVRCQGVARNTASVLQ